MSSFAAVELFIVRARQVQPDFFVTDETGPQVARICRRLDGLPLAIELAAARVRMMSPGRILEGLDDRFRLLTGGGRSVARQRTLRSSMEWSHDLLGPDERVVFRRLAVFVGGFTLDAAERVIADELIEAYTVLDLLSGLVDKSLVVTEPDDRFRLLESVREFAHEQLVAAGESEAIRGAHLEWVVALAGRAAPHLVGAEQQEWLARLDADHPNLRERVTGRTPSATVRPCGRSPGSSATTSCSAPTSPRPRASSNRLRRSPPKSTPRRSSPVGGDWPTHRCTRGRSNGPTPQPST